MILVDLSSLAFSAFYALQNKSDEGMYRYLLLNTLRSYNTKYRAEYGQMVIACDGRKCWRKALFPHYKAARTISRTESDIDWNSVFEMMNTVRDEIRNFLPFKFIHIDDCEADDVIAILVKSTQEFGRHEECLIISSDGDCAQLQKYGNVKQLCPKSKKLIRAGNPIASLREKILRGDAGDGVPNVLSPDDSFITHTRQKSLTSKKVTEWLSNWSKLNNLLDESTLRNIQRNERLISFEHIPEDVEKRIINTFEDCKIPPKSGVFTYLIEKRCGQLASSAADFFPNTSCQLQPLS